MVRVYEPIVGNLEREYLCQAIDAGEISSGGSFVRRFEEAFAAWSGNEYAIAVSSGTAALEVAIWALQLKEISIPTGTIISCYVAAIRAGATVHLHDNDRVKGDSIMRCHLFGEFDPSEGNIVVDDLSQYWKPYRVKNVGTYSLYANKLMTCGEGGIIVTNDRDVYDRARAYRDLCHSKERFVHYSLGYNFRMSNLQAAVALAQLEQIDRFVEIKKRNYALYAKYLPSDLCHLFRSEIPWMNLILTYEDAGAVVDALQKEGVECRRFFYPMHLQPCLPKVEGDFPNAEGLRNQAFYLPSGLTLTEKDIEYVSEKLRSVLRSF